MKRSSISSLSITSQPTICRVALPLPIHLARHILGSAFAAITFNDGTRLMMSGDLGRFNTPMSDPSVVYSTDYLVMPKRLRLL